MRIHPLALLLAFVLGVGCAEASAQWMWRDSSGRVTVSDRPPPLDVPASAIVSKPPGADHRANAPRTQNAANPASSESNSAVKPVSAVVENGSLPKDPALEARRKKAEAEVAEKRQAEEQKNAEIQRDNCRRARSNVTTLESGVRLVQNSDKGEREVMDDRARAEEMRRAREIISSNCK